MTQVAAVSCAATQVPDTKPPSHNFLKVGLRNALQVEAVLVMVADSMVPRSQCISGLSPRSSRGKDFRSYSCSKVNSQRPIFGIVERYFYFRGGKPTPAVDGNLEKHSQKRSFQLGFGLKNGFSFAGLVGWHVGCLRIRQEIAVEIFQKNESSKPITDIVDQPVPAHPSLGICEPRICLLD
jgi:hypothetical protein